MMWTTRAALAALIIGAAAITVTANDGDTTPEGRARRWIEAFNSGEADYAAFCEHELAPGRASTEERVAMYRRMREDLGPLELTSLEKEPDGTVEAKARSERRGPVRLVFRFEGSGAGRISGVAIELAGADPGGEAELRLPPLELPQRADDPEALRRAVDAWLASLAANGAFSGSVLLARDGMAVFEGAYGLADRRAQAPNRTTTRFNVGSITKTWTTVAVAQLAAEGRLTLDDTIAQHLPDYPDPEVARKVTLRQLVDHSSGLGDIFVDAYFAAARDRFRTPRDFFPLFAGRPLQFEPGQGRAYSNAGFVVLGAIVESVSGEPYTEYVQRHVLVPAGMTSSGFFASDGLEPDVAVGYTSRGCPDGPRGPCRSNLASKTWAGCPAGGSHATAADLLRFDEALRSHRLTPPEWTRWVMARIDPGSGGPVSPQRATWAWAVAGGAPGTNAELDSDGHDTVIVLANLDPPIAQAVAQRLKPALGVLAPPQGPR